MMLKLVDTSQKVIILGIFILDKVTRLRALLDPPPPQDGVSEFTGRYPLSFIVPGPIRKFKSQPEAGFALANAKRM